MKPEITKENLVQTEKYLSNFPTEGAIEYGVYSSLQTDIVFPTIRSLFKYGQAQMDDNARAVVPNIDFAHVYGITSNFDNLLSLVAQKKEIVTALLANYKAEQKKETMDKIMKLEIAKMTGEQFREYLIEIGIIK